MLGVRRANAGLHHLLLLAGLLGCGSHASSAPTGSAGTEPGSSEPEREFELHEGLPPKVFKGDNGISLEMVYLAERDSVSTALVRFTGVDHMLAGKVFLATRKGNSEVQGWEIPFDGSSHVLVQVRMISNSRESTFNISLILPRVGMVLPVVYDEEGSEALSPITLVSDHKRHQASGALAQLAAADRAYHIDDTARWLKRANDTIETACREKVPAEIDWDSFPDEAIIRENPCPDALEAVAKVCTRDTSSRRAILTRVKRVVCGYAEKKNIQLGDDNVLYIRQPERRSWDPLEEYWTLSSLLALTQTVARDKQGRILMFNPDHERPGSIYIGDGKTMRRLAPGTGGYNVDTWGILQDVRLRRSDNGWTAPCRGRTIEFLPVDDATRLDVIKNAVLIEEPLWRHREFALARDDRGNYYYVDRDAVEFGGQNYRVFRGPRGQVRQMPLTDIVDDSDGKIFATKEGKLRLVLGDPVANGEATWIEGKSRTKLVRLPLVGNEQLIYTGLGAYDGETFGTICD